MGGVLRKGRLVPAAAGNCQRPALLAQSRHTGKLKRHTPYGICAVGAAFYSASTDSRRPQPLPHTRIAMLTLFHQPLCPRSRYVRLILGEYGIQARAVEERYWERRDEFLLL